MSNTSLDEFGEQNTEAKTESNSQTNEPGHPTGDGSYELSDHSYELTEKQHQMVQQFRNAAEKTAQDGKPMTGIAMTRIADYVRELILLRRHRNEAFMEYGDRKTTEELNNAITDILRDLKRNVPYHKAFGSKKEWKSLPPAPTPEDSQNDYEDALDPAIRDYDWSEFDT